MLRRSLFNLLSVIPGLALLAPKAAQAAPDLLPQSLREQGVKLFLKGFNECVDISLRERPLSSPWPSRVKFRIELHYPDGQQIVSVPEMPYPSK